MNKNFIKQLLLISAFIPFSSISQTPTFDYLNNNLGSNCNVFSPNVSISGETHASFAGGVNYSSTLGLGLSTYPSGSSAGGTAFTINYTFTTGYSYTIAVTALGDNALILKTAVVPNLNQFSTHGTNLCTPDSYVTGYNSVGTGNLSTATSTSSTTYTTPSFTVSSPNTYLLVWATGGLPNLSLDVLYISKIVITKTATGPTFTLPPTTNVSCGLPTTFTVTTASNPNNLTITDYTWNLGATPNGWLYNGIAAPQTVSTGTTNNISLTPGGSTLTNISATVTAGGNTYNTNTSTINVTAPSLSITGNSFCSGTSTFSLNVPAGMNVSWISSDPNILSIPSTGNPVTATAVSDGTVSITATINPCGTPISTTSNNIVIGPTGIPSNISAIPASGGGYYIHFTPVTGVNGYSFDWFDLTTNSQGGNTQIGYSPVDGPSNFVSTITFGHSFKFRLATYTSSCGIGTYSPYSAPIIVNPCSLMADPATFVAQNACGTGNYCSGISLSWGSVANAAEYEVEYVVFNLTTGSVYGNGTYRTTNTSAVYNFSYSSGLVAHLRVRAKCSNGLWGNLSAWSANYAM